jgi:hypothetical protein
MFTVKRWDSFFQPSAWRLDRGCVRTGEYSGAAVCRRFVSQEVLHKFDFHHHTGTLICFLLF